LQSNRVRAAIGVATIAAIVVLFIVLSGGDDNKSTTTNATTSTTTSGTETTTTPAQPAERTVVVRGGKPVGGVQKLEYTKGDRIRFVVKSDISDEVHVHGYDIPKEVKAGGSVSFSFPANLEGVFEIELESRKEQIAELRVSP
jgi:ABC-type Fe3+-hydroxamate transport system substrate-binding protein